MKPSCSGWTDWSKPDPSAAAAKRFKKLCPKKSAAWTKARSRASAPSSIANPSRQWPTKDSPLRFPHGPNIERRYFLGRSRPDQGTRAVRSTPGAHLEQRHFQPTLRHGDCDGADQPAATSGIPPHAGTERREPAEKILAENQPGSHAVSRALEPENRTGQTGRSGNGHHGTEPNRRSVRGCQTGGWNSCATMIESEVWLLPGNQHDSEASFVSHHASVSFGSPESFRGWPRGAS